MARSEAPSDAAARSHRLNLIKQLRLGLAGTYYSMAHTLGLRRIQDFLQVFTCWRQLPVCHCVLGSSASSRTHTVGGLRRCSSACLERDALTWPPSHEPHCRFSAQCRSASLLLAAVLSLRHDRTSATFHQCGVQAVVALRLLGIRYQHPPDM